MLALGVRLGGRARSRAGERERERCALGLIEQVRVDAEFADRTIRLFDGRIVEESREAASRN